MLMVISQSNNAMTVLDVKTRNCKDHSLLPSARKRLGRKEIFLCLMTELITPQLRISIHIGGSFNTQQMLEVEEGLPMIFCQSGRIHL